MDNPEFDANRSSSLRMAPEQVVLSEGQDHALAQLMAGMDDGARWILVLGAEGPGMRQNTREHCDAIARLPITESIESLNVSNAAAVALYAASIA